MKILTIREFIALPEKIALQYNRVCDYTEKDWQQYFEEKDTLYFCPLSEALIHESEKVLNGKPSLKKQKGVYTARPFKKRMRKVYKVQDEGMPSVESVMSMSKKDRDSIFKYVHKRNATSLELQQMKETGLVKAMRRSKNKLY